ncbi:MAG: O-acetyl-ADP-ribose deacetylase [uncultured Pyrinomonadaceae bacterium]|uniref:O-acetyl-ADP-ribose deacetylase n=1 Tax=uncultured Pyrinomonadaceae bacterium TaxID=2283094 RepID=A0A6J4QBC8_9BACT|nr:MAG: O-acetyl-ADP-ribose deacetylase [uncultured Pyrinomonadaceae bacterium]
MQKEFFNNRVIVKVGDITQEKADAIVNAANSTLLGGGGVDGAIHARGGKRILEECREIRKNKFPDGLPTGEAVITSGGNLLTRFVIHTVGPIYRMNAGKEAKLLAKCYVNSLALAVENNLQTVAFPSISTGAFAYPKSEAAQVSSKSIEEFLSANETIEQVRLVFFSEPDALLFVKHQAFVLA